MPFTEIWLMYLMRTFGWAKWPKSSWMDLWLDGAAAWIDSPVKTNSGQSCCAA